MREGQNGQIPEGVTSSFLEAERGVNDLDKLLTENNSQEEHGEPRSSSDVKPKGKNIKGVLQGVVVLLGGIVAFICSKRLFKKVGFIKNSKNHSNSSVSPQFIEK